MASDKVLKVHFDGTGPPPALEHAAMGPDPRSGWRHAVVRIDNRYRVPLGETGLAATRLRGRIEGRRWVLRADPGGEHRADARESFDSGVAELDDWLRRTAPVAAAAGTSATWVLCRGQRVVGYYALAMGSVEHAGTPSRLRRGQPDPVPVLLLARLALDRSEQGAGLGADLLREALIRAVAGGRRFGARALVVDAIDDQAVGFYQHHGFIPLAGRRLYRRISDIERAIGGAHR